MTMPEQVDVIINQRLGSYFDRFMNELSNRIQHANVGPGNLNVHKPMGGSLSKRIEQFTSGGNFQDWKFKLLMSVKAINSNVAIMLEDAAKEEAEINFNSINQSYPDKIQLNYDIYYILAEKLTGDAFDIVKNVPNQNGVEAWRRLCARYDAKTFGKQILVTRKVVNPPKIRDLRQAAGMIEK